MIPINNPKQIDPALLTLSEYYHIVNKDDKSHPSDAYRYTIEKINQYNNKKSEYPKLIQRVKLAGIYIEIRLKSILKKYIKTIPNGNPLRINNELQYYNEEEIEKLGLSKYEYSVAAFDDEQKIGFIEDEWGCVLVVIAEEYQGIGLGTILQKLARTMSPGKSSGGFTPDGINGFIRVHREFVRDALKNGTYSKLIRSGQMTINRVKEIVDSARVNTPRKTSDKNYSSNNPADWLLYVGEYGDFILYDKKLLYVIEDHKEYFVERMIKGAINIREIRESISLITLFGGESDKIKSFMLKIALSYSKQENMCLYIDKEDMKYLDNSFSSVIGKMDKKTGYERQQVILKGEPVPFKMLGMVEKMFRKKFDNYDEFYSMLIEMAYGKYKNHS